MKGFGKRDRYAHKKLNLACKVFWKMFVREQSSALSLHPVDSLFKKKHFFYLVRYTKFYAKTRNKFFENSMTHHFSIMYEICITSIFS